MTAEPAALLNGTVLPDGPDGSHRCEARLPDGTTVEVVIPPDLTGPLLAELQRRALSKLEKATQYQQTPTLQLKESHLVHGPSSSELMLSTYQIGHVVIQTTDEALAKLREMAEQLTALRSQPRGRN